jgi:DNA-binding transcriptional ArsR family regulator
MQEFIAITKALAEENRVRILCLLKDQELCVCQIIEVLGLAPSTTSKHLSVLHHAKLVMTEKKGRWVYYSLPPKTSSSKASRSLSWLFDSMENDPKVNADVKQLKQVLKLDPEQLCKVQAGRC